MTNLTKDSQQTDKLLCPVCRRCDYLGELVQWHEFYETYSCVDCMPADLQELYKKFEDSLDKGDQ